MDPDLIRCDLLKIKRMLYLSYKDGSPEQLEFLKASKLSELGYLSRLVPEETITLVYEEYNYRIKEELIYIGFCLVMGFGTSLSLFGFHQAHPNIVWLSFYKWPFGFGFYFSLKHIYHMIQEWRKIQPFRKEHSELLKRMAKLKNEIKDSFK